MAIAGLIAPIVAFRTLFDPRQLLAAGDLAFFHLPLRTLLGRALAEGLPWWNAAIHGGQPILSNPNYAAFYPPSWIALVLPPATAIHLLILGHVGGAYAGAWRLARHLGCRPVTALTAAIGFTLSGAFVSSASLLTLFCGLAWAPWILLWGCHAVEPSERVGRRGAVAVAIGLTAQFLAGEPVNCILSALVLVGLAIDARINQRGPTRRLALAVVLALALAGVQLLPTLARVSDSGRAGGLDPSVVTHRSMPPARLLELAVPHPFGDPMRIDEELFFGQAIFDQAYPYLVSIYPGLVVLVLAIGGLTRPRIPRRSVWLVMLGGGLFLALGRFNPLYMAVVPSLPVLDQTRYPEKMFLAASIALPFLAALSLESRLSMRSGSDRGRLDVATFLCAFGAALVALLLGAYLVEPEAVIWLANSLRTVTVPPGHAQDLVRWARVDLFLTLLVAGAAWWLLGPAQRGRLPPRALGLAVLCLLALDLGRSDWRLLPVVPRQAVDRPPAVLAGATPAAGRLFTDFALAAEARIPLRHDQPGPDQFWHGLDVLEPYIATLWGYHYAMHHDYDLMLTRPARRALEALENDWNRPDRAWRLLGTWNVGTVALQRPLAAVLRGRLAGERDARLRLEANPHRLPEVRWVERVAFHPDSAAALAAARRDDYRSGLRAHWIGTPADLVEETDAASRAAPPPEARISWSRLEVDYEARQRRFLQIARTWDSGWRASLDGEPLQLYQTATGQIGLVVPAGAHRIVLRYRDPAVLWGTGLTLAGLLAAVAWWRPGRRRAGAIGSPQSDR